MIAITTRSSIRVKARFFIVSGKLLYGTCRETGKEAQKRLVARSSRSTHPAAIRWASGLSPLRLSAGIPPASPLFQPGHDSQTLIPSEWASSS